MQKISFLNLLEIAGLLTFSEDRLEFTGNPFVMTEELTKTVFIPMIQAFPELLGDLDTALNDFKAKATDRKAKVRFTLASFKEKYSKETFEWTKCPLRIDIDEPVSLDIVLQFIEKLPIRPQAVSKTNKGWHVFYITKDKVELKDEDFIANLISYKDYLLSKKSEYSLIENVHVLHQVMTRYSEEVYLLSEPKQKEELLLDLVRESTVLVENAEYGLLPARKLNLKYLNTVFESCPIMRTLEQTWEYHTYEEWFLMSWKYALLAHISGDKHTYKQEFINKSLKWKRGTPDINKIEYQFEHEYKKIKKGDGFLYLSCKAIHQRTQLSDACSKCIHARWVDGELKSSFIRDLLNITIPGYELDEEKGFWMVYTEEGPKPVCEYFVIEDYLYFHKPDNQNNFLKITTKDGTFYINIDYTTGGAIDLSKFQAIAMMPTEKKEFKSLIERYISSYILRHGRRVVSKVGYNYNTDKSKWEIVIANRDNYRQEDMNFFMYGLMMKDRNKYYPSTSGDYDAFQSLCKDIFRTKDPITLLLLGYFLTHIVSPYLQDTELREELNTIVFLRGTSGTGKTTRLKLASALYGTPATIDVSETTITRIEREFGNYKIPLPFDEIRGNSEEKKKQIENLIYLVANQGTKAHAYSVYEPITVPTVIAGEPQNLPIEEMLTENEGLFRRSLVISLDDRNVKQYEKWMSYYNKIIKTLMNHHGFVYKLVEVLESYDRSLLEDTANKYAQIKLLQETLRRDGYREQKVKLLSAIDNLLARIIFALRIFADIIGIEDETWSEVIDNITTYVTTSLATFYKLFLPREKKLEDEVVDFLTELTDRLYKLKEDKNNVALPKSIAGFTLDKLLKTTKMRIPSTQTMRYAKDIVLKRMKNRSYRYTHTVLVNRIDDKDQIKKDIERLLENIRAMSDYDREVCLYSYINTAKNVLSDNVFASLSKALEERGIDVNKYLGADIPPDEPEPPTEPSPSDGYSYDEDIENDYEETEEPLPKVTTAGTLPQAVLITDIKNIEDNVRYDATIYFDIESDVKTQKPVLLAVYQQHWKKVYILDLRKFGIEKAKQWLMRFNTLSGWGLNYDLVKLQFSYEELKDKVVLDLLLLAKEKLYDRYIQDRKGFSLDKVLKDVLGVEYPFDKSKIRTTFDTASIYFTTEQLRYVAFDVYYLPKLFEALHSEISIVQQLDQEALKVCVDVSLRGLPFLQHEAQKELKKLNTEITQLTQELGFNPLSPQQTKNALQLPDTREKTLRELILNNGYNRETAEKVLLLRKKAKEASMLRAYLKNGSRIYGNFWTTVAPSGRMGCDNENLQQIPRSLRHLFGFTSDMDKVLITADFPQIELRLAGAIWREPKFVEAFKNNKDLHKLTASVIYNVPLEQVTKEQRQIAKSANFGLIYGASPKGFLEYCIGNGVYMDLDTATVIHQKFFETYTKIASEHEDVRRYFSQQEIAEGETWLGRKYVADSPQKMLNYQIQGSGAELFKRAITELKRKYPSLAIVNLVHDEIVVEATEKEAKDVAEVIKHEMEQSWEWCLEQTAKQDRLIEKFKLEVEQPSISKLWEKG